MLSRKLSTTRLKGERKGRRRGTSTDFADYRNYVSGDDLRHLDWKIYARLEKLFLKLFLEEENLHVHVLLDTSASMAYGEPEKLHYARRLAAAIGYITLCRMDLLTIRSFGEKLRDGFGPKRGKANAAACFDFLGKLEATQRTALAPALRTFAFGTRSRGLVVILSDFYDPEGYEQALRFLFGRNLEVFVIHLLSPEELRPTLQGDLRLVDAELGDSTDISVGKTLLDVYQRSLNTFTDGLRQFVIARGGTYLLTPTDTPFERLVLDVFARRGLVQ